MLALKHKLFNSFLQRFMMEANKCLIYQSMVAMVTTCNYCMTIVIICMIITLQFLTFSYLSQYHVHFFKNLSKYSIFPSTVIYILSGFELKVNCFEQSILISEKEAVVIDCIFCLSNGKVSTVQFTQSIDMLDVLSVLRKCTWY